MPLLFCDCEMLPPKTDPCNDLCLLCSSKAWHDPETYFLLLLDVVYCYAALLLLFGLCHCCGLVFGEECTASMLPGAHLKFAC